MSRSLRAAAVVAVLAGMTSAGCTGDPADRPAPTAASRGTTAAAQAPSPAASAAVPPRRVRLPAVVKGELTRVVIADTEGRPDNETTFHAVARAGQEYYLHAACVSTTPGKKLSYEVRSGKPGAPDEALSVSEVPCDATTIVNGLGTLPVGPITVDIQGIRSDVPSAYAVVVPTSDLPTAP